VTLIVGLNLSDRLYLAADTRVSFGDGKVEDNALKILPLLDKKIYRENSISVAVAGDVELATFLYNSIYKKLCNKELSCDIRQICDSVGPSLENLLDEWTDLGGSQSASCCLLFAGIYKPNNKRINRSKLKQLVEYFEDSVKEKKDNQSKIEELVKTDPIFKKIDKEMRQGQGIGLIENLALSDIPNIPAYIQEALDNDAEELTGLPDSLIFSANVDVAPKNISIEKAEWGELLAYGGGLTKNDLPKDILAHFELTRKIDKSNIIEAAILTTTILDLAEKNNIRSIGGTVLINALNANSSVITGKDLHPGGQFKLILHDVEVPLIPFNHITKVMKAGVGTRLDLPKRI